MNGAQLRQMLRQPSCSTISTSVRRAISPSLIPASTRSRMASTWASEGAEGVSAECAVYLVVSVKLSATARRTPDSRPRMSE